MNVNRAQCAAHEVGCAHCRHFDADGRAVEQQLPGVKVLGSAYGSVRAGDGLCRHHDRYVAATSICPAYRMRAVSAALRLE